MVRFLIDENLPYYYSLWNSKEFVHVLDLENIKTDNDIWDYAKKNNLIIVTKDSDFSNKILYKSPPPKVIHIRFGNLRIQEFYKVLVKMWTDIDENIKSHKLVNVYKDRIESLG
jgi:predicted nuclease of predicted toxin-antitoxin system